MADFVARLGTTGGQIIEKAFVSESRETLRKELDGKGYYVFSIQSKSGPVDMFRVFRRRKRLPVRQFMVFNHELATLLKAGLPVLQGLNLLLERMENEAFRTILTEIREQVKNGTALSEAFGAHPEYFPPLYAASLKAGERSGDLEGVIRSYISYTKIVEDVRKRVQQAIIYPVVLMSFSAIVVYVLLTYAIPRFADMYNDFAADLPLLTKGLIWLSAVVSRLWWVILLAVFGGITVLRFWSQSKRGSLWIDLLKLRVPFVGSVWQKFAVSQLTRALATLLRGGIPLVTALDVAAGSVGNRVVSTRTRAAVKSVSEGEALSAALEHTRVLQPMVIEMVKVGESTGALAEMLANVSDYYDEDISHDLQRLLTMLEPLLLIFMGSVIATMLVAMYMPIFELQSVAQ